MTQESAQHLTNLKHLMDAAVQKGGFFKTAADVVAMNRSFEYAASLIEDADRMTKQRKADE